MVVALDPQIAPSLKDVGFVISFAEYSKCSYAYLSQGHLQRLGLFDHLKRPILRVPALFFMVATIADLP